MKDLKTIEHMQKMPIAVVAQEQIEALNLHSNVVLIPDGYKTQSLESYQKHKDRYDFKYSTQSIPDFVEYAKEFDNEGSKCFITQDMTAYVIFDLGTVEKPGHSLHNAALSLHTTAAYRALLDNANKKMSQKQMVEFLQDWEDFLKITNLTGDIITPRQAANLYSNLTLEKVNEAKSSIGDYHESMEAMERIEAKASESLPGFAEFKCVPYFGLTNRHFTIKFQLNKQSDSFSLQYRIIQLENEQEDILNEFKSILVKEFKDLQTKAYLGYIGGDPRQRY